MKLEFPLIRYLGPAIEPGFEVGARDDWRLLVSPRLRRMWPEIPPSADDGRELRSCRRDVAQLTDARRTTSVDI